mgnify:CR=1 FL=1
MSHDFYYYVYEHSHTPLPLPIVDHNALFRDVYTLLIISSLSLSLVCPLTLVALMSSSSSFLPFLLSWGDAYLY